MSVLPLNAHTTVDATSGVVSMTLPTGATSGTEISCEKIDATANAVNISGSIRGVGSSTLSLTGSHETVGFLADASGSWWPIFGRPPAVYTTAEKTKLGQLVPGVTGTPTAGQVPVASSGTAVAWGTVAGGGGSYTKPAGGIPETDLTTALQTSIDTALHQSDLTTASTTVTSAAAPTSTDGLNGDGWLRPATSQLLVYPPKTSGAWSTPYGVPFLDANGDLVDAYAGHAITTGCTTWPRFASNGNTVTLPSGTVRLTYFTCPQSFTAATITGWSGATAAATVTYGAMALYSVAANGDLTRIAITTSDTTLFTGAAETAYVKTLTASVALTYGIRYAVGTLIVATTAPTTHGQINAVFDHTTAPMVGASLASQSTLPATITAASIVASQSVQYAKILP